MRIRGASKPYPRASPIYICLAASPVREPPTRNDGQTARASILWCIRCGYLAAKACVVLGTVGVGKYRVSNELQTRLGWSVLLVRLQRRCQIVFTLVFTRLLSPFSTGDTPEISSQLHPAGEPCAPYILCEASKTDAIKSTSG